MSDQHDQHDQHDRHDPRFDPHRTALAATFASLNEELLASPDEPVTFDRVVKRAVEIVPGCDHASLTLVRRRQRPESVAVTDQVAEHVDELQYELEEGPCLDAAFEQENFVVHDLRTDGRWPRWAAGAVERGLRSSLSIRLHTDARTLGALNLFGDEVGGFDEDAVDTGVIFASHAAEALNQSQLVSGLRAALESRHLIGMAQGVLAVRYDLSYEQAFAVLHRYSNEANVKLREVARQVLERRKLPDDSD